MTTISRLSLFLSLSLSLACYESRTGCIDPDATNYDLTADEACDDGCCNYPSLNIRLLPLWGDTTVVRGATYRDGAGNTFQLVRFRYYLGELRLEAAGQNLPSPERSLALRQLSGGNDTTDVELPGNLLLGSLETSTTNVGMVDFGRTSLVSLTGTYGLPDAYRTVLPPSAPSGSVLRTQPGRLNFRDGRGYVQSRLEYTLTPGGDTLSVSSYGSLPFDLSFGEGIQPVRGFNLRLDVEARLDRLFAEIDLTTDSASIATALGRDAQFLVPIAITQ